METFFTVENYDLERLTPSQAVDFFSELLWAEASLLGIGKNLINIPSAINVRDGGIDAEVKDVPIQRGQGIIKKGLTCYQIKTGLFKISQNKKIKEILFKKGNKELHPKVKYCLDKGGTLIVVLFGWDNPQEKENQIENRFKSILNNIDPIYQDAKIEIWQQNHLIGFLKPYPSLIFKLKDINNIPFQTHGSWSENKDMRYKFVESQDFNERANAILNILRSSDRAKHIRILGVAGCGKTRFVLEAIRKSDIAPLVLYFTANQFIKNNLFASLYQEDNRFNIILVIDECDLNQRIQIWDRLSNRGSRIKIISISNEPEPKEHDIIYLEAPTLNKTDIKTIIKSYGNLEEDAERYAVLAENSPRFAHMIGINLKRNPEDILRPVDNIYDRIIANTLDPNSDEVKRRKRVLIHIALFKRFGYKRPFHNEAKIVAKFIERQDRNITFAIFQEIVNFFINQNILQGENTLYITTPALHIKKWIEWWETYGYSIDFEQLLKDIPENTKLREWFFDMFRYAAESGAASRTVKFLLSSEGPFKDEEYLKTELGSRFFLSLAEADPRAAVDYLKRTIEEWSKDKLLDFTSGRRQVVFALEKIAVWKETFLDAARLLLALGEAENEAWSNNASGVFVELFSPGVGQVAPTEASLQERFPVLKEALGSVSKERRLLGLKACDQALETQHFTRIIGAEYQGIKKVPKLWIPETYGELYDAYRQIWQFIVDSLDNLLDDEQQKAVNIILNRSRGLSSVLDLTDMVINTIEDLVKKPYVKKRDVLAMIITILRLDGEKYTNEIRKRWEKLKNKLTGEDFSSLLKRYVGMDIWEDRVDEKGNSRDKTISKIKDLIQIVIKNIDLLFPELRWLVTNEAKRGDIFGYELGKLDKDFSLLPKIIEAQKNSEKDTSVIFLGGYFRSVFEKNPEERERQFDLLMENKKLNIWIPELTIRSGMSDRAALRILSLAEKGVINYKYFRMFFVPISKISEEIFKKWIEFLLKDSQLDSISIALDLYSFYYISSKSKIEFYMELTFKLLSHPSLLKAPKTGRLNQEDYYNWSEIGKKFVDLYPDRSFELAEKLLINFGEHNNILDDFSSMTPEVLNKIATIYPKEIWERIEKYISKPDNRTSWNILRWLEHGAIDIFPEEYIWKWADKDKKNTKILARVAIKYLKNYSVGITARNILIKYGSRKDIRNILMSRMSTEIWSGPMSEHYLKKKEEFIRLKETEDNENVNIFINEYIDYLHQKIEWAKNLEERENF